METKLEKICKTEELEVGNRYCMSQTMVIPKFIFEVTSKTKTDVRIRYLDDVHGLIHINDEICRDFYEFPYSSLEKELL
jgi:hypothetical protein